MNPVTTNPGYYDKPDHPLETLQECMAKLDFASEALDRPLDEGGERPSIVLSGSARCGLIDILHTVSSRLHSIGWVLLEAEGGVQPSKDEGAREQEVGKA